ncbi:MAG TPA: pantoate--beta-alanine ligase [Clostridiales bacterium]|nr:pantoate--beta-alanine ligase [Clostridiales bacterium]
MKIIRKPAEAASLTDTWHRDGLTVGFVPTMGYLHPGHLSLIQKAREENQRVVVSIFVNPLQFGPKEDFSRYPRNEQRDLALCREARVDMVFIPSAEDMYPSPLLTFVDVGSLGDGLCGASRPGHFRGVATVVAKLFHIIRADRAYFGEKDAQQLAIIQRMTRDLDFGVEIVSCSIVRDPDGLAMSSRNTFLSPEERKAALSLSRGLFLARQSLEQGERSMDHILKIIRQELDRECLVKVDYVAAVDPESLKPVAGFPEGSARRVLLAVAAFAGKTRLIDNIRYLEECI